LRRYNITSEPGQGRETGRTKRRSLSRGPGLHFFATWASMPKRGYVRFVPIADMLPIPGALEVMRHAICLVFGDCSIGGRNRVWGRIEPSARLTTCFGWECECWSSARRIHVSAALKQLRASTQGPLSCRPMSVAWRSTCKASSSTSSASSQLTATSRRPLPASPKGWTRWRIRRGLLADRSNELPYFLTTSNGP
jgi:hypothetical protein